MTNEEVINVLDGIYNNPTASEQVKEACIVAMEAVDIKNSVERITTGLQISSAESKAKDTMTNAEAIKTIKNLVETLDDYSFYTEEDKVAFDLAIKALEREETCENKDYGTEMIFECSVCGASTIDRMNFENGEFNFCPNCGRRIEK